MPKKKKITNDKRNGKAVLVFLTFIIILIFFIFVMGYRPRPYLNVNMGIVKDNNVNYLLLSSINNDASLKDLDLSLTSLKNELLDIDDCDIDYYNMTYSGCSPEHRSKYQIFLHCPSFPRKATIMILCKINSDNVDVVVSAESENGLMIIQKNYLNCSEKNCTASKSDVFIDYIEMLKDVVSFIPIIR